MDDDSDLSVDADLLLSDPPADAEVANTLPDEQRSTAHHETQTTAASSTAPDHNNASSLPEETGTSIFADESTRQLYEDEGIQELAEKFLREAQEMQAVDDRRTTHTPAEARGRRFSMIDAFTTNPDLLILLVGVLDLPQIISLYAIDRRFHYVFNSNIVAYIRTIVRRLAPGSEEVFPFHCYKNLCLKDPLPRVQARFEGQHHAQNELVRRRDVPSLRWLQMVVWREGICTDILIQLALHCLRCPPGTKDALKRMWFMLDLPLNAHRIALVRSPTYMDTSTLTRLTCFFMKLDMRFTDPAGLIYSGDGTRRSPPEWAGGTFVGTALREYMLAERHLTSLWRVLHGWSPDPADPQLPINRLDMVRLYVRHKWVLPNDIIGAARHMTVFGVPNDQLGQQQFERPVAGRTQQRQVLLRPDQLVLKESIRRKLALHRQWVSMIAYGIRDEIGRPIPDYTEAELNEQFLALRCEPQD